LVVVLLRVATAVLVLFVLVVPEVLPALVLLAWLAVRLWLVVVLRVVLVLLGWQAVLVAVL
jgi:hypothetical protein